MLGEMLLRMNLDKKLEVLCIPQNVRYIKKRAAWHEGGCTVGKCHIYVPRSKRY